VFDYCQRRIPKPDILLPKMMKAVELRADVKDAKAGEIFFSKATWKVDVHIVKHVKLGCVSDMPRVSFYYYLTRKSDRKQLMFIRGTSQLERSHAHLQRIIPGFHTLPRLVTCLLTLFIFNWNIDRVVERGILDTKYVVWYNHDYAQQLQILLQGTPCEEQFQDYTNYKDFVETGDTCFTPVVRELASLQHASCTINNNATANNDGDVFNSNSLDGGIGQELSQGLSSAMQFNTKRHKEDMAHPITPVLKYEESKIELLIQRFHSSQQNQEGNRDQNSNIDYPAATEQWNSICHAEIAKPVSQRAKMYPRTSQLVKDFHKQLLHRRNKKRTLWQPVQVTVPLGVIHTDIASREVIKMRQELHQQNQAVQVMEV
jgi:hypothetical protein